MALLTEVVIDGIDVTDYLRGWRFEDQLNENINTATIQLDISAWNVIDADVGDSVTIKRGFTTSTDEFVFDGYIDQVSEERGIFLTLVCRDKLASLIRLTVTKSFDKDIDTEAGVISEIFKTLINTYGGGTLVADATSVQSTASLPVIAKFKCDGDEVYERCKFLANLIDWQFYYKASDGKVYFEPKGYLGHYGTLTVGAEIAKGLVWTYEGSEMANNITVKGAVQEVETTESGQIGVTSGYTTDYVQLTQTPVSTKVYCDAANPPTTLRRGGIASSTSTYDYIVDKLNMRIEWSSSYTPIANDHCEVRYSYNEPVPITGKDYASIARYGERQKTFRYDDLKTVADAENMYSKLMDKYSVPFIRCEEVRLTEHIDLISGQTVRVTDEDNDEDRTVLILSVIKSYPYDGDIISVGDKEIKMADWMVAVQDKIKELEKQLAGDIDILNHVIALYPEFKPRKRYTMLQRDKIFDSFCAGHPVNGLAGMGKVLDEFESSSAVWTGSGVVLSDDAVTYRVGSGSMKLDWTNQSYFSISTAQSFGDISSYTGVASGTPTQGTIGVWWYSANTTDIDAFELRIGSSASVYAEYTAREYRTVDGYNNWLSLSFGLYAGWNYFLFDLDDPLAMHGSPDWTACDYARIYFNCPSLSTSSGYIDYFTISSSNYIGLNGAGDRSITMDADEKLVQGDMTYDEYCYDDDFHNNTDSTATFSTVNKRIDFTAGQVWYSNAIDVGTTLSYITVEFGTLTGSVTIEVSSDNKATWQTLTEGTKTLITSSNGLGTYLRITENAAGTARVERTLDSYNQVSFPAIRAIMEE